jgi:hypothetical protein
MVCTSGGHPRPSGQRASERVNRPAEQAERQQREPTVTDDVRLFRRMRLTGRYSVTEVKVVLEKAVDAFGSLDVDRLRAFFKEAEREHQASQAKGRFLGTNSCPQLCFKLDQAIEQRRVRLACS